MTADVWTPFRLAEPWRASAFTIDEEDRPLSLDLKPLPPLSDNLILAIPALASNVTDGDAEDLVALDTFDEAVVSANVENSQRTGDADFWNQDFDHDHKPTSALLTWETFQGLDDPVQQPLSEASQAVFNALANRLQPTNGILPQNAALRSLCSLALGRSSLFYQWSETTRSFVTTIDGTTV